MTQQQMEFYTSKMLIFNRQGNMYQPEAKHEFCLFFANMFPLTPATIFIFISLFVPDAPAFLPAIRNNKFYGRQREVTRRLAAYQLHENCTPPRISPSCPHLLRRLYTQMVLTHDFMTGQEYHYACCLLSPCQQQTDSYNLVFSAHQNRQELTQKTCLFFIRFCCFYPYGSWRTGYCGLRLSR